MLPPHDSHIHTDTRFSDHLPGKSAVAGCPLDFLSLFAHDCTSCDRWSTFISSFIPSHGVFLGRFLWCNSCHFHCATFNPVTIIITFDVSKSSQSTFLASSLNWLVPILLGLALSSERLCVFGLHGAIYIYYIKKFSVTSFSFPFNGLSLVGLALDEVD